MGHGTFTVVAGPFSTAPDAHSISGTRLGLRTLTGRRSWLGAELTRKGKLSTSAIASVEVAHEESAKSFAGSAAAGIAGGLLLGPVGALAGLLAGGNRSLVTFVLTLEDGRRALCTAKSPTFRLLQAAAFKQATASGTEPGEAREPATGRTPSRRAATPEAEPRAATYVARWAALIAVLVGIGYGGWWYMDAPERRLGEARYEAEIALMRRNFPRLSDAELRQRVDEFFR